MCGKRFGGERMIQIKHKTTGKVLKVIEADTLRKADLSCADLRDADLSCADLRGADLSCADLRGADLRGADLRFVDLSFADLRGAKGEFIFNWGVKLKVVEEKE
jgi:uncharacterized protein YjbI with pentapeptide repeats